MPDFQHCRNTNKGIVMSFLKQAKKKLKNKKPLFDATGYCDASMNAMYLLRRMQTSAEEHDMGFCGFFVTKDGKYYYLTSSL